MFKNSLKKFQKEIHRWLDEGGSSKSVTESVHFALRNLFHRKWFTPEFCDFHPPFKNVEEMNTGMANLFLEYESEQNPAEYIDDWASKCVPFYNINAEGPILKQNVMVCYV